MDRRQFLTGLIPITLLFTGCSSVLDSGQSNDTNTALGTNSGTNSTSTAPVTDTETGHMSTVSSTGTTRTNTAINTNPGTNPSSKTSSKTIKSSTETSNLATYKNRRYSYTIKHLPNWNVDDSDPSSVEFIPPSEGGAMGVLIQSVDQTVTVNNFTDNFIQGMSEDNYRYRVKSRNAIALYGRIFGLLFVTVSTDSATANPVKTVYSVVKSNGYMYTVILSSNKSIFKSKFKRKAKDIAQSLRITDH